MFDLISLFTKKDIHPLAREAGVTEILTELPAEDPAMALEELTHWLIALSNADSIKLKERVKRLARIDQSAQKYERRLRRQYLESSRMHRVTEGRIWNTCFNFLEASINAHLRCVAHLPQKNAADEQDLTIVLMRTFRRLDLQAHWLYLRYSPVPPAFWERVFSAIKIAEERSLMQRAVTLNSEAKVQTTVAQEMLKLLMMSVAGAKYLTKIQIDLAHLLTQNLASTFRWEQMPNGGTAFHVDFSQAQTPTRLTQASEHHFMSRCFGSSEAVKSLITGLKQLERGSVPTTLGVIDYSLYKRQDLLEVVTHLAQRWSKLLPSNEQPHFDKRHAERKQVLYRINVVQKLNTLYEQLLQPVTSTQVPERITRPDNIEYQEQVDLQIYGFITEKTRAKSQHQQAVQTAQKKTILSTTKTVDESESWVVENISQMGYGVTLANLKEDWVQAETIIGIQSDASWKIGLIRRLASESIENTQIGIQILSNRPAAAMLQPADKQLSIWETAADTQISHHTLGILMHREPPYQEDETLLLAADSYQLHRVYEMLVGQENRTVRLLDRLQTFHGVDQILFTNVDANP
jgi:hypothetical protein